MRVYAHPTWPNELARPRFDAARLDVGCALADGLIALYPMTERGGPVVYDLMGNAPGTPVQRDTGSTDYVRIAPPRPTSLYFAGGKSILIPNPRIAAYPISVSYWATLLYSGASQCHFGIYTSAGIWIAGGTSNLDSGEYLTGINNIGALAASYTSGQVYHIAQVYTSSSAVKVYFNGVDVTYTGTGDYFFSRTTSHLGSRAATGAYPMSGELGMFALWNRELTRADILRLMNEPWCLLRPSRRRQVVLPIVVTESSVTIKTGADALALLSADPMTGSATGTLGDVALVSLADLLAGTATGTIRDAVAASILDAMTGTGAGTLADVTPIAIVDRMAGTAAVVYVDAVSGTLVDALTGTASASGSDTIVALVADVLAGSGTLTAADAVVLVLAESGTALSGIVSVSGADSVLAALADALAGTGSGTVSDVVLASVADVLTGAASGVLSDGIAVQLAEAAAIVAGLVSVTGGDNFALTLAEAVTLWRGIVAADVSRLDAVDAVSPVAVSLGSVDTIVASVNDALVGAGVGALSDVAATAIEDAANVLLTKSATDTLVVVLSERGVAVVLQALPGFLVGTLTVTWAVNSTVSLFPVHTLDDALWPTHTVEQIAA